MHFLGLGEICSIVMAWALEEDFVASGEAVSARATSWLAGLLFKKGGFHMHVVPLVH